MINSFSFTSGLAKSAIKFSFILGIVAFSKTGYCYPNVLQKTSGCFSKKTVADGNDSVFRIWYELEQSTKSNCNADFTQQSSVSILVQPEFFEEVFFNIDTSEEDYWAAMMAAIGPKNPKTSLSNCDSLEKIIGKESCDSLSGLFYEVSNAGCCSLQEDVSSLALLGELLQVIDEKQAIRFFMHLAYAKNSNNAHRYFSIRFQTKFI